MILALNTDISVIKIQYHKYIYIIIYNKVIIIFLKNVTTAFHMLLILLLQHALRYSFKEKHNNVLIFQTYLRNSSKISTEAAILSHVIINLFFFKQINKDASNLLNNFLDIPQTLQKILM